MIETPKYPPVPWTLRDTWIGVILLVAVDLGLLLLLFTFPDVDFAQNALIIAIELLYVLPVATVFLWRPTGWNYIGFRKFTWASLGLGCGLLVLGYSLVILHGAILLYFGIETQGDMLMELFASLDQPIWFVIVGVIMAPVVEEIFFRGFLFQGFRERMGWLKAAFLSSAIFSISHLDPVSLFPTFILGFVFSYLFHRSNSLWPGVILHFTVNAFGILTALLAAQYPTLTP